MVHRTLLLTALLALALAGCVVRDDNTSGGLVGTSWTVVSIDGQAAVAGNEPTLIFEPEGLSGSTGCNGYSTTFRTDGDRIVIAGAVATTDMACPGERDGQQAAFLQALAEARTWRQGEDGNLTIAGGTGLVARPQGDVAAPGEEPGTLADLHGTEWLLVAIDGVEDLGGVVPTLTLTAEGRADGFGGCNGFGGAYSAELGTLKFESLVSTKMACAGVGDAVERRFLTILQGASGWSIEDGRLTITGEGGRLLFTDG